MKLDFFQLCCCRCVYICLSHLWWCEALIKFGIWWRKLARAHSNNVGFVFGWREAQPIFYFIFCKTRNWVMIRHIRLFNCSEHSQNANYRCAAFCLHSQFASIFPLLLHCSFAFVAIHQALSLHIYKGYNWVRKTNIDFVCCQLDDNKVCSISSGHVLLDIVRKYRSSTK